MTSRATFAAAKGLAATPSDTVSEANCSRAIYVSAITTGRADLLLEDDTAVTVFNGLIAGVIYPFRVKRVNNTSLGATITLLY